MPRRVPACGDDHAQNQLRLLGWAMDHIAETTDDLERCSIDPSGKIPQADVREEVRACRKWLALARKEIRNGAA
jgi:hypothetical protein